MAAEAIQDKPAQASAFLGLQSYTEDRASSFFGRDEEKSKLTTLIQVNTLTIVFGRSGTGKTSLLNAGVFPKLRKSNSLPFRIRLEFNQNSPDLVSQIKKVLKEEIDKYGFKVKSYPGTETLWEYFHKEPLWQIITPILVFDQFEEIFTLAKLDPKYGATELPAFWQELSDVIENNIPEKLREQFQGNKDEINFDYRHQKTKVVFSFREEYLPEFENITAKIPSIKFSRFRLMPMNGHQAYEVITKTWGESIREPQAKRLISYLTNEPNQDSYDLITVEPSLLSQVCAYIDRERINDGTDEISPALLDKYPKELILRSIYNEAMQESNALFSDPTKRKGKDQPAPMNVFVEDKLITSEGYRTRYSLSGNDRVLLPGIQVLEKKYFLRMDDGTVELTHDVLAPLIKTDREKRQKKIAEAIANKKFRNKAILIGSFIVLVGVGLFLYSLYEKKSLDSQREILQSNIDSLTKQRKQDSALYNFVRDSINQLRKDTGKIADGVIARGDTNISDSGKWNTGILTAQKTADSIQNLLFKERKDFQGKLKDNIAAVNEQLVRLRQSQAQVQTLNGTVQNLEARIADLKRQIAILETRLANSQTRFQEKTDSFYTYRLKYPVEFPPPPQPVTLPEKDRLSLNIKLGSANKALKKLPDNLTIYLVPEKGNAKLVTNLKEYQIHCDYSALKKAKNVRVANYYQGEYFVNDLPAGSYLVKICSYYGNYVTIERQNGYQKLSLDLAPPVQ